METFCLTLDVGNQRVKLRRWCVDGDRLELVGSFDGGHGVVPLLDEGDWDAARGLVSSVGSDEVGALWDAWAEELGLTWERPEGGLELRVAHPESVGRDRVFAARGALQGRSAALVVDAGTATTVDAAREGAFLGGAILPGAELGARALHEHTARLPRITLRPTERALGGDTKEALLAGLVLGTRGATAALVERAAVEAGFDAHVPVVLTGGARSLLLEPTPFTTRAIIVEPELVHLGLLHAVGVAS